MKLGLVLAGGGGKGSYQIGVWKYLKQIKLDKQIAVISGTSVGGLNAALMATTDYKTAEYIWTNEIDNKILDTSSESRKNGALFSRTGLVQLIDKYVNLTKIKNCGKQIYVTCYNTEGLIPESFNLNQYNVSDIKKMLCATSAIPLAFQNEEIFGKTYIDGGVKDNVPIAPLLKEKCTHALIVNLDENYEDYSGFNIKTVVLQPSINLGDLFSGTMDFSLENSQKRIEIGYNDCKNIYSLHIKTLLEHKMNDEEIKKANKINEMNDNQILLETIKIISVDPTLVGKIQCNLNWTLGTMGGHHFWKVLAEFGGWKFQQNHIFQQVRLLDPMNNRQLWGDKAKIVSICKNFLIMELNKESEAKLKYGSVSQKDNNTSSDLIESRLAKLNTLFEKGLITEEDYNRKKDDILNEI